MRQEKQLLLDQLSENIESASALVITRYGKLKPDVSEDFRGKLAEAGGTFSVVQKRVFIKAAKDKAIELNHDDLQGHIGIVFTQEDPIAPTKVIYDFAKKNADTLEVLGGHFEGRLCSAQEMKQISQLPSKDEMRSQLLGLFEAPMSQTLSVMEALLTSIPHCLENKKSQE